MKIDPCFFDLRSLVGRGQLIFFFMAAVVCADPTMRELSDNAGIKFGFAIKSSKLTSEGRPIAQDASITESESQMVTDNIRGDNGSFSFNGPDGLVDFAEDNNMPFMMHDFFHKPLPAFMANENDRADLINLMTEHIETIMNHYMTRNPGVIQYYHIGTEIFLNSPSPRTGDGLGHLTDVIGPEWLEMAFNIAHKKDPSAVLMLNEVNAEGITTHSTAVYNWCADAIARGVPVHGIGFHALINDTWARDQNNLNEMRQNFQRFIGLGMQIWFSEMGIKINTNSASSFENQATAYYNMLNTAMEYRPHFKGVLIFGLKDDWHWLVSMGQIKYPLLFDDQFNPKPAYYAVRNALIDNAQGTVNRAPYFRVDPVLKQDAAVDIPYSESIAGDALDPDTADTLTFSKVSGPVWLTVAANGTLSGIPLSDDIGLNQFTIRVQDAGGLFDEAFLKIAVNSAGTFTEIIETFPSSVTTTIDTGGGNSETIASSPVCNLPKWGGYHSSTDSANSIKIMPAAPNNILRIKNAGQGTYVYADFGNLALGLDTIQISVAGQNGASIRCLVRDADSDDWYASEVVTINGSSGNPISGLDTKNWFLVSPAARDDMNQFDNGGETPLGLNTGSPVSWGNWDVGGGGLYTESAATFLDIDSITWTFLPPPWPEDIFMDRMIDLKDIEVLADQWLQTGAAFSADINLDDEVNLEDFVYMAKKWLTQQF